MKLRSTTWKGRNRNRLVELKEEVIKMGYAYPKIADIGIGGVTYFIANLLPEGPKKEMNSFQQAQGFFIRIIDNLFRKYGCYGKLKNYELEEVQNFFASLNPSEILVVDNDPRILTSVNKTGILKKLNLDICKAPLPDPADILICYNVLQISSNPSKGLENLLDSVAARGILSIETNGFPVAIKDSRYKRLSEYLYLKY